MSPRLRYQKAHARNHTSLGFQPQIEPQKNFDYQYMPAENIDTTSIRIGKHFLKGHAHNKQHIHRGTSPFVPQMSPQSSKNFGNYDSSQMLHGIKKIDSKLDPKYSVSTSQRSIHDSLIETKFQINRASVRGSRNVSPKYQSIDFTSNNERESLTSMQMGKDLESFENFSKKFNNSALSLPQGYIPTQEQIKQFKKIEDLYKQYHEMQTQKIDQTHLPV